jgi:hypothetical protein
VRLLLLLLLLITVSLLRRLRRLLPPLRRPRRAHEHCIGSDCVRCCCELLLEWQGAAAEG